MIKVYLIFAVVIFIKVCDANRAELKKDAAAEITKLKHKYFNDHDLDRFSYHEINTSNQGIENSGSSVTYLDNSSLM